MGYHPVLPVAGGSCWNRLDKLKDSQGILRRCTIGYKWVYLYCYHGIPINESFSLRTSAEKNEVSQVRFMVTLSCLIFATQKRNPQTSVSTSPTKTETTSSKVSKPWVKHLKFGCFTHHGGTNRPKAPTFRRVARGLGDHHASRTTTKVCESWNQHIRESNQYLVGIWLVYA